MKNFSLSLVITVYNEEEIIEESVIKIINSLDEQSLDYEVIIVDDGSTDSSVEKIKKIANGNSKIIILENLINLNQGISIQRGAKVATKKFVTFNGIDIPIPVGKYEEFIKCLGNDDLLVIQRKKSTGYSAWRHLLSSGNRLIRKIFFPFLLTKIYDLNFGQIYRQKQLESIAPFANSPAFTTPEMVFRAFYNGLKIKTITCEYMERPGGKVKLGGLRDIMWTILDMIQYRLYLFKGKKKN
jgi:glycosyltransferase involved in cell wall biosynthesis